MSEEDTLKIVEQLRIRYRKEALEAIEAAEIRGYERAKSESDAALKILHQKLADAIVSKSAVTGKGSKEVVKDSFEKLYKYMKQEFAKLDGDEMIIERIRVG